MNFQGRHYVNSERGRLVRLPAKDVSSIRAESSFLGLASAVEESMYLFCTL